MVARVLLADGVGVDGEGLRQVFGEGDCLLDLLADERAGDIEPPLGVAVGFDLSDPKFAVRGAAR